MSARTKGRMRAAAATTARCGRWAAVEPSVRAVAVVGSYAYGRPRQHSDLDLVVLSDEPDRLIVDAGWWADGLGRVRHLRTVGRGAVTELRFRRRDGLHLDVAIGKPSWAASDRLDAGTARVVADGCVAVYDPDGLIAGVVAAVAAAGARGHRTGRPR